jgi:hypothetical protein
LLHKEIRFSEVAQEPQVTPRLSNWVDRWLCEIYRI